MSSVPAALIVVITAAAALVLAAAIVAMITGAMWAVFLFLALFALTAWASTTAGPIKRD